MYTGHKNRKMVDGKSLVEWLKPSIADECKYFGVPMPTDKQIAVVASSMRMHTLIMHAAEYDYSKLGEPEVKDDLWPMQSSIGRYFRDAARETLDND